MGTDISKVLVSLYYYAQNSMRVLSLDQE